MSKIKTLFEDSAKQTAIYPRTKFSAVSDTNGNTLGDVATLTSTTVVSGATSPLIYAQPFGIDTSRLINETSTTSYTATEDCWCVLTTDRQYNNQSKSYSISIDSVVLANGMMSMFGNYHKVFLGPFFIKEGQTISISGWDRQTIKAYGLKY